MVFDLDGTLYHQGPVRRGMLAELLLTSAPAGEPGRVRRLLILRRFRRLREELALTVPTGFEAPLFARLSAETGQDEATLRRLVEEWMEVRPLGRLRAARLAGASGLFAVLRARGTQIAVWSDYPVHLKLAALGLQADHVLSALDPAVAALKPDPAGLKWLLGCTGVPPEAVLMVGDRNSHDGAAARALGVDFLLRSRRGPPGVPRVRDFCGLAAKLMHGPAVTKSARGWPSKLMRYGLTGGLAAVADLGGFAVLLASGMSLPAAATLSFLIATVINYLLSSHFAFQTTISFRGYMRFLTVASLGLGLNVATTILADASGLPALLAKLVGITVAFGVNFLLNLSFVFPPTNRTED